jgi:glycosyltransferase involved in cell wall biosynthesis
MNRPASAARPVVSFGLPVRNGAPTIAQALESVLAQTFDDWELIISDNLSTDGTSEICAEFATRDARILARELPRDVPPRARNLLPLAGRRRLAGAGVRRTCRRGTGGVTVLGSLYDRSTSLSRRETATDQRPAACARWSRLDRSCGPRPGLAPSLPGRWAPRHRPRLLIGPTGRRREDAPSGVHPRRRLRLLLRGRTPRAFRPCTGGPGEPTPSWRRTGHAGIEDARRPARMAPLRSTRGLDPPGGGGEQGPSRPLTHPYRHGARTIRDT